MKIYLRLTLNCTPDVAWNAIASPAVFRAVSHPLLSMTSLEPQGFPERWPGTGPHKVKIALLGFIPMGTQTVDVRFLERPGGVRMVIDTGTALTGPLAVTREWDHRMAVTAAPGNKTLYRDRLIVKAGVATPAIWLGMWFFWQFRARRLRALAPTWELPTR
jgi:hypothetical protein